MYFDNIYGVKFLRITIYIVYSILCSSKDISVTSQFVCSVGEDFWVAAEVEVLQWSIQPTWSVHYGYVIKIDYNWPSALKNTTIQLFACSNFKRL